MKKLQWPVVVIFAAGVFAVPFANGLIFARATTISTVASAPTSTLALIFGGGMNEDGTQNAMQQDRVRAGIVLYKLGVVEQLMMTGDDGGNRDDEVGAMRKYAIDHGVPAEDVLVDPHGYRTYESCYREAKVYGITSAIVISQEFHLPRIHYLCEHFGIKTIPVSANLRSYGFNTVFMNGREVLARLKAVLQVNVTKPLPRSLEK